MMQMEKLLVMIWLLIILQRVTLNLPSVEVTQEFFLEYFTSLPEVRKKFKIDPKGKKVISK